MSEITVASTTDTQHAIELAAGNREQRTGYREQVGEDRTIQSQEADQIPENAGEEGSREKQDSGEDTAEGAGATHASGGTQKSSTEKQIEALTQKALEQQEELEALRNQITENESQRIEQQAPPADEGKPTRAQYGTQDEFIEALAAWKAEQILQQERQSELAQAEQARTREVFSTYNDAAKSARTKYPDFEKVVGRSDLKIPQAAQVAIIEAGQAGPDIAYYLGKHPAVCKELTKMSPMRAIARIGQIEGEVTGNREQGTGSRPEVPGHRPQAIGTRKSPPAPITPVGGSASRSSVPLGELPYRDYKRVRDQEERGNR